MAEGKIWTAAELENVSPDERSVAPPEPDRPDARSNAGARVSAEAPAQRPALYIVLYVLDPYPGVPDR